MPDGGARCGGGGPSIQSRRRRGDRRAGGAHLRGRILRPGSDRQQGLQHRLRHGACHSRLRYPVDAMAIRAAQPPCGATLPVGCVLRRHPGLCPRPARAQGGRRAAGVRRRLAVPLCVGGMVDLGMPLRMGGTPARADVPARARRAGLHRGHHHHFRPAHRAECLRHGPRLACAGGGGHGGVRGLRHEIQPAPGQHGAPRAAVRGAGVRRAGVFRLARRSTHPGPMRRHQPDPGRRPARCADGRLALACTGTACTGPCRSAAHPACGEPGPGPTVPHRHGVGGLIPRQRRRTPRRRHLARLAGHGRGQPSRRLARVVAHLAVAVAQPHGGRAAACQRAPARVLARRGAAATPGAAGAIAVATAGLSAQGGHRWRADRGVDRDDR